MTSPDQQPSSISRRESPAAGYFRVDLGQLFVNQRDALVVVHDEEDRLLTEKFLAGHALLHHASRYSRIAIRSWRPRGEGENVSISIGSPRYSEQYLITNDAMTKADTQSVRLDDSTIVYLDNVITSAKSCWTVKESQTFANEERAQSESLGL